MPAKKRGKGFSRKKKKSPSPAASGGTSKKAAASKKPPKTPQVAKKADSAASSKRKEKEVLALSVPRRYSPRLLAIRSRKMSLENGSLIPASTNTLGTLDQATQEDVGDHLDYHEIEGNHLAGSNNTKQTFKKRGSKQQQQEQPEDGDDLDMDIYNDEQDSEVEPAPKVSVDDMKEWEDDNGSHGVYMYFWRTAGVVMRRENVKDWIYTNVGDREAIGSIRYCNELGKGFYFVYFDREEAREKALSVKAKGLGLQVTVFPWSPPVNEQGQDCTPRMVVLPGLTNQYFRVLPSIGNALGMYIGGIGALDPDADMDAVRSQGGWESTFYPSPACDPGRPRIAVLMPVGKPLPSHVELQIRKGVKKQRIYEAEEEPPEQQPAVKPPSKRAASARAPAASSKKLKA